MSSTQGDCGLGRVLVIIQEINILIDYILMNSRFRNALLVAKTFPGADCGSDHIPVCGTIRLELKKIKSAIRILN